MSFGTGEGRARVATGPLRALLTAGLILATLAPGCGGDAAPGDALPGDTVAPGDTAAEAGPPETPPAGAPAGPDLPPWTVGDLSLEAVPLDSAFTAEIVRVETGRHETYDRLVLELDAEAAVPAVEAGYVDTPVRECGSGREVRPPGDGWLRVRLSSARGHTAEGEATVPPLLETAALGSVLEIHRLCDFEGEVDLVLAVAEPTAYRIARLEAPARIVVDVRHPGTGG